MHGHVIKNTKIAVDLWVKSKGKRVHFLTHCHADHMSGLTDSWKEPIYTSQFNAWMLKKFYKLKPSLLVELTIGETHIIKEVNGCQFSVTLIDANHCPGAVMFLFEGYFGTILYTGDFRYHRDMLNNAQLERIISNETLDVLYLDNTYASENCVFPSRYKAGKEVISIIRNHPGYKVYIGLPNLGKEELLRRIALELNEPVYVNEQRMEIMRKLNFEEIFTTDPERSRFHVVKKSVLTVRYMTRNRAEDPKQIAVLPSALFSCGNGKISIPYNKSEQHGIYVVAYSDHSSNSELHAFVSKLKPVQLVPIINTVELSESNDVSYWEYLKTVHKIPRSLKMLCQKVKRTKSNYHVDVVEGKDNIDDGNKAVMAIRNKKIDQLTHYTLRKRRVPKTTDRKGVYFQDTSSSDDQSSETEFDDDIEMEEMLVTLPDSTSLTVKTSQTVKKNLNDIRVKLYDISKVNKSQAIKTCKGIVNSWRDVQEKPVDCHNQLRDDAIISSSQYLETGVLALAQQCTSTLNNIFKEEPIVDGDSGAFTVIIPSQEEDIKDISLDIKENIYSDNEENSSHSTEHSSYSVQVLCDNSLQRFLKQERERDDDSFESRKRKRRKISGSQSNFDVSQIEYIDNEREKICCLQANTYTNLTNETAKRKYIPELVPKIVNILSLNSNNTLQYNTEASIPLMDSCTAIEMQSQSLQTVSVTSGNHELNVDLETLKKLASRKPITSLHIQSTEQVATADTSQSNYQMAKQIPDKLSSIVYRSHTDGQMLKRIPKKLCTTSCRSHSSDQVAKQIPTAPYSGQTSTQIPEDPFVTADGNQQNDQVAKWIPTASYSSQTSTQIPDNPFITVDRSQRNNQVAKHISQKSLDIAHRSQISDHMITLIYDKPVIAVCSDQVEKCTSKSLVASIYSNHSTEQEFYTCPLSEEQILSTSESGDPFFSANEELDSEDNTHDCNLELSPRVPTGTQVKLINMSGELELFNNSITRISQLKHLSQTDEQIESSDGTNKVQCVEQLTSETERTISFQSSTNVTPEVGQRDSRLLSPTSNASKRVTHHPLSNPSVNKRCKCQVKQKKINKACSLSFTNRSKHTCVSVNDSHEKSFILPGNSMQTNVRKALMHNYWMKYPFGYVYDFLKISDEIHSS